MIRYRVIVETGHAAEPMFDYMADKRLPQDSVFRHEGRSYQVITESIAPREMTDPEGPQLGTIEARLLSAT